MTRTLNLLLVMSFVVIATELQAQPGDEIPVYVGQEVCRECHVGHGTAALCSARPAPEHDTAFASLTRPESRHIGALCGGIEEPTKSRICLGCHGTAADVGRRWMAQTFRLEDGVQCEACHNAGSHHVEWYRQHAPTDDPPLPQIARSSQAICESCHMVRPSHQEVLERGYRRPAADVRYKTPSNLAMSADGKWLYVICEHSNSVIVVDLEQRRVAKEIEVGRRPHGVFVTRDGSRLFVTNRLSDSVTVIDTASHAVLKEAPVGGAPHGIVADPTEKRVFVANSEEDSISILDAETLQEIKRLASSRGPWDLALSPDGLSILVTNVRPAFAQFRQPSHSELTHVELGRDRVSRRLRVADASALQGIEFVPSRSLAIFTLLRFKNLVPSTRLAQGWTVTNGIGVLWPDGTVDQVLLDCPNEAFPDPNDVAISPDERHVLVTSGGSDCVALVDLGKLLEVIAEASATERRDVLPNHLGTSSRFLIKRIPVGRNPRGLAFSPDGRFAYVANALDDTISIIDTRGYTVAGVIDLGGPEEVTETRWGERLFHSAERTFGQQFSCRSCHPDGHINGLSFDIEADGIGVHPVDNRTLRGILDTAPFKWDGTNPTLHRQCGPRLAVFFTRVEPFAPTELDALVRYLCTIQRSPNRHRRPEGLTLPQRRGKMVFDRTHNNRGDLIPSEQRCVTCHTGGYKTSRKSARVGTTLWLDEWVSQYPLDLLEVDSFGTLGVVFFAQTPGADKAFDVPHLVNVYNSAPYLHNGGATTLEEIWTLFNLFDRHGMTTDLTRQQFNDLITYLKAL